MRETKGLIGEHHPMRGHVALWLGVSLAQEALGQSADDIDIDIDIAEALRELELADEHRPVPELVVVVRHLRAALHAMRFMMRSGADSDREFATVTFTELIDDPGYADMVDNARTMIVGLQLSSLHPAAVRTRSVLSAPSSLSDVAALLNKQDPSRALDVLGTISEHVDALASSATIDPQLVPFLAMIKSASMARSARTEEELTEALGWAERGLRGEPDEDERALLETIRAALHVQRAQVADTKEEADKAVAVAGEAIKRLDDAILPIGTLRDVLGLGTSMLTGSRPPSPDEVTKAISDLRVTLDRLRPNDPARVTALSQFTVSMSTRLVAHGMVDRISDIRELVENALTEASDATATAHLNLLFSMVNMLQGMLADDATAISAAIADFTAAVPQLPADHPVHSHMAPLMTSMLGARFITGANRQDVRAAFEFAAHSRNSVDTSHPDAETAEGLARFAELLAKMAQAYANNFRAADIDQLIADFEGLPEGLLKKSRMDIGRQLSSLKAIREAQSPLPTTRQPFVPEEKRATRTAPDDYWGRRTEVLHAAMHAIRDGVLTGDTAAIDRSIALVNELTETTALSPREKVKLLGMNGAAFLMRFAHSRRGDDLDQAISRLEHGVLLARQLPGISEVSPLYFNLGQAYHMRCVARGGDRMRAVEHGLIALRERAGDVLLQLEAGSALAAAEPATDEAAMITRWCLAAGRDDLAVHALEIGRSLVLHSITVEGTVPALLSDIGRDDLAAEWREQAAPGRSTSDFMLSPLRDSGPEIPSDLRYRVLTAFEGTTAESRLFTPPPIDEITAALHRTSTSALVYLLPRIDHDLGFALVVHVDGRVETVRLPALLGGESSPLPAYEHARRTHFRNKSSPEWRKPFDEVCDWAWRVAMGPVLERLPRRAYGQPVRFALVPVGELGAVPWHAARRVSGRDIRYACQDAVIAYAASARQFVDAASRPCPSWSGSAALVRIEDHQLFWAELEVETIRAANYPGCPLLDDVGGEVEPADVLGFLPSADSPGASVLHLSCHAHYATPAVDSALGVSSPLHVRDILAQAKRRAPDAEGGLVVLAACASDLTEKNPDEALTLSTSFIAAGASGAVGARWEVDDLPTSLLMIMFHHYLNHGYDDPALALRAAQLWMLNPGRVLPSGAPRELDGPMRRADLDAVGSWAAFTYQGR